jgi:hypothetical protein
LDWLLNLFKEERLMLDAFRRNINENVKKEYVNWTEI